MARNNTSRYPYYVFCLERGSYRIDLEIGKIYRVIRPHKNDPDEMLRIIDDSAEDYLYPSAWFVPIELPPKAKKALVAAGG
jgi:hypothetical protein